LTVFVEIYSADVYRGCHVQHSRNRVDVLVVRFSYLLSLSGSLQRYLSVRWAVMAGEGEPRQGRTARPTGSHHTAIVPPSRTMVVPLIYAESSQARKTAALPTSTGRPSRRNGVRAISGAVTSASTNA
jgi:hypothetical protein